MNRDDALPALTVTVVSMGIGSGVLLTVALAPDGIPRLTLASWLVVLWLAVINTALALRSGTTPRGGCQPWSQA